MRGRGKGGTQKGWELPPRVLVTTWGPAACPRWLGRGTTALEPHSSLPAPPSQLCASRHVTSCLWASIFSSAKWEAVVEHNPARLPAPSLCILLSFIHPCSDQPSASETDSWTLVPGPPPQLAFCWAVPPSRGEEEKLGVLHPLLCPWSGCPCVSE